MNAEANALVGYAVLRANYDAASPTTYVDSFAPFAIDILARQPTEWLEKSAIGAILRQDFKLTIPDAVVGKVLGAAVRKRLVEQEAGRPRYKIAAAGQKQAHSIAADMAAFSRQQAELVGKYEAFVAREFADHPSVLGANLADQLAQYLESHAIPLLSQAVHGVDATRSDRDNESGAEYVVARFIANLADSDVTGFNAVEDAAKGAVLAAVVTLDTGRFSQRLNNLTVYLDTPFLIKLLGFDGTHGHVAAQQLVDLCIRQGATVAAFEHSVRELRGVLNFTERVVRSPNRSWPSLRDIDLHFLDAGATPSDVLVAREGIPAALIEAKVDVRPTPDDYHRYGLDESALEALLQKAIGYRSESTRLYDVKSISAIHRLRRGSTNDQLEMCRAVLVTDNTDLARASLNVEEHAGWPLVVIDGELASLLWARSPALAEDLSRSQIIATAYAGMQPDGHLWSRYLDEVRKLEARGSISAEEAVVLRSTLQARESLMDETLGIAGHVSANTPSEVLDRLRADAAAPVEEDLARARQQASAASASQRERENELESALEDARRLIDEQTLKDETRRETIARRADAFGLVAGRWIRVAVYTLFFGSLALAVASAVLPDTLPPWVKIASGTASAVVLIAGVAPGFFGGSVVNWLRTAESGISARRRRKLLADGGFDMDDSNAL